MVSIEGYTIAELVYATVAVYVFTFILVGARILEDRVKGRSMKTTLFGGLALLAIVFVGLLFPLRVGSVLLMTGTLIGLALHVVYNIVTYKRTFVQEPVVNGYQQQPYYGQQAPARDFTRTPMSNYPPQQMYPQRPHVQPQQRPVQQQPQQRPMSWEELQRIQQQNGNQSQYQRRQ